MPFITIELPECLKFSLSPFSAKLHPFISESLDIPLEKLKTKVLFLPDVIVGHGDPMHTYAHIKLELMRGRDKEKLSFAAKKMLEYFHEALKEQNPDCKCRVTCEFREIDPELLFAAQI